MVVEQQEASDLVTPPLPGGATRTKLRADGQRCACQEAECCPSHWGVQKLESVSCVKNLNTPLGPHHMAPQTRSRQSLTGVSVAFKWREVRIFLSK